MTTSEPAPPPADLATTLAFTDVVERLRAGGMSIDEAIATLRACTSEVIAGLRADVILRVLAEGPGDMKVLIERAKALGCTLHHGQVQPVIADGVQRGNIKAEDVPTGQGRAKTVFTMIDDSDGATTHEEPEATS